MADKEFPTPGTTLELLDSVPESLLRRLKQYSGRFSTEAVRVMQDRLPFFAELEASQRASLALVVQTAVANFVEWMTDPNSNVNYTARAFELLPQDLTRRMPLRHSVDMIRVTLEFFEEVAPLLARSDEQLTALTVGILKYSRDLAFSAATAYADAAEARGNWDSRMEASVVDAVVRGDTGPELLSRAAALNWDTTAPATVVVGFPPPGRESHASQDVRDIAARHGRAALTDVHGTYLVAIVSGQLTQTEKVFGPLLDAFSDGPVVIGPTAPMLTAAYHSASEAISRMGDALAPWRQATPAITTWQQATGESLAERYQRQVEATRSSMMSTRCPLNCDLCPAVQRCEQYSDTCHAPYRKGPDCPVGNRRNGVKDRGEVSIMSLRGLFCGVSTKT